MNRAAALLGSAVLALAGAAAHAEAPFGAASGRPFDEASGLSLAVEFERWRARAEEEGFAAVEETLLAEISGSENARRLTLFYMAHGLWPEALSIIRGQTSPNAELTFLEGVANYQMGRWDDAVAALNDDRLGDSDAAAAWRGLANFERGAKKAAADDLFNAPPPAAPFEQNAADFFLARAAAAYERGETERVRAALETLRGRLLSDEQRAERRLAEARLMLLEDKRDSARSLLKALAEAGPQPAANRAALELMKDRLAAREIDPKTALENTDALFLAWSGGAFEREALEFKTALHDKNADIADAFRTRRRIIETFPESDAAAKAQLEMRERLSTLFDQKDVSPMIAAEIFYENIDVAPPGREGDALIRHVADDLAALDLLEPAAELLRHQVFNRLRGPERSETAADLAAIYLADDRAEEALQSLRATRLARLPTSLDDRRRLLEARALVETDDADAALDLVADDETPAALRLRGDIHWAKQDWSGAGAAYAASLSLSDDAEEPLDGAAARTALKAAAAFALAGDVEALGAFEDKIKNRLGDENLRTLMGLLVSDGPEDDPARFLAAYEDYFQPSGGDS